ELRTTQPGKFRAPVSTLRFRGGTRAAAAKWPFSRRRDVPTRAQTVGLAETRSTNITDVVQWPFDKLLILDSCISVHDRTKLIERANISPSVHLEQYALKPAVGRNRQDGVDNMHAGRDGHCLADHRRELLVR